jgi:arylsulfatase A-like enzyme
MRRMKLSTLLALFFLFVGMLPVHADEENRGISHVIVVGMDNYHLVDIEEHMPNLWGFLQKGALSTSSHHPNLPTRTAPDFSSIAGGHYPDRHGVINNSFFLPAPTFRSGFAFWENRAGLIPPTFLNAPEAPWNAFNAAGWDVGAVGFEGLVLETRDEVKALIGHPPSRLELDQYLGLAIHHADGSSRFGTAQIPAVAREFPQGWVNDWSGPPRKHAAITLRMATLMQAAGVPVTFAYVENTHTRCDPGKRCEFDLKAGTFNDLLEADDAAFGRFFRDLAELGITWENTLFVITTDEGDHYLENFARPVPVNDLGPVVVGSNALFYGADADALAGALAGRPGVQYVASRAAMKALHISAGGDARTPTFMAFSDPDSTVQFGTTQNRYRWNHGNIHPDITDIWVGLVGPGIRRGRLTAYTEQVDLIPTIRALLDIPLGSDTDGVAITTAWKHRLAELRETYKQLNAPLGEFGMDVLRISTAGVKGGPDARAAADERIAELAGTRNDLVAEMRAVLDGASSPDPGDIASLLTEARELLAQAAY